MLGEVERRRSKRRGEEDGWRRDESMHFRQWAGPGKRGRTRRKDEKRRKGCIVLGSALVRGDHQEVGKGGGGKREKKERCLEPRSRARTEDVKEHMPVYRAATQSQSSGISSVPSASSFVPASSASLASSPPCPLPFSPFFLLVPSSHRRTSVLT